MKKIVILGGGFAGITTAKALAKTFSTDTGVEIVLVNRSPYHEFHADLYEVATSPDELTSLSDVRNSTIIPLQDIFARTRVQLVSGEITSVDLPAQTVLLGAKTIEYDYLVYALGSVSCYYNIPGAQEYSLPLKTVVDALRVRNALEFAIQRHRQDTTKYQLRIAIVGGGFTGVELSAELAGLLDFLCWKHGYPRDKVEIAVLEASNRILNGLADTVSQIASSRFRELEIHTYLNSHIVGVDSSLLSLANGERLEYDVLIWTAGVEAHCSGLLSGVPLDRSYRVQTNEYLQVPKFHNVFFIGDTALNPAHDPLTAQYAIRQAKYVAGALPLVLRNKKPIPYTSESLSYIIPLGGRVVVLVGKRIVLKGFIPYLAKLWATFRYYRNLVGFSKALGFVWWKVLLYGRNNW